MIQIVHTCILHVKIQRDNFLGKETSQLRTKKVHKLNNYSPKELT